MDQKLWSFKCTMLTTLNSDFLDWEDTLNDTVCRAPRVLERVGLSNFSMPSPFIHIEKLSNMTFLLQDWRHKSLGVSVTD